MPGQDTTPPNQVRQSLAPSVTTSSVVAPSDTTAVVSGTVTPNGAFTSYWFDYTARADMSNLSTSPKQTVGSGFAPIPAPGYITGLSKDTTYYFRLVGENSKGRTVGVQYAFHTSSVPQAPVGSAPTVKSIAATGVTKTAANLRGEVTPNRNPTQYWFEYGTSANLGDTTAIAAIGDGTAKLSESITLTGLATSTTYYFRLNAQNIFGTVNGAILNFKTK